MAATMRARNVPTWVYAVGAAGAAAVLFVWRSSRQRAQAAAIAAATPSKPTPSTTPVVPAQSYGTSQNAGALQNIQTQLQNLQASQAATAGSTAAAKAATPTVETSELAGAGYYPREDVPGGGRLARLAGSRGGVYQYVADPTQRMNAFLQGLPLFYQPVPGVFQEVKDFSQIPSTTPFFLKAA